jgi:hypothetical protein
VCTEVYGGPVEELLYYVVGFSLTIIGMIASVAYWLGRRFALIERKFDALRAEFEDMREDFARAFEGLKSAVSSSHALTLDFLALKGLLDEKEAGFVKAEIERTVSMVRLNPITKEELEFLKKVVAKDVNEITLEEAERIIEIGKRWWFEDGSEAAYKVFLGGLVIRGYIISKAVREGRKPWLEPPFKQPSRSA